MSLQFTQQEVESELKDVLKFGDVREMSLISGIGESYLKSQFNPDDERKSAAYCFLQIQCALDEINAERGEEFFQKIVNFRELSKKRKAILKDLNLETGKLNREVAEFVAAKLEGKPYPVQLKELLDIEKQILEVKSALIGEYNELKETPREAAPLKLARY